MKTTFLLVELQKPFQNDACCELSNIPACFIVVNGKYGMRLKKRIQWFIIVNEVSRKKKRFEDERYKISGRNGITIKSLLNIL